jgi:hypothetical protein
LRRAAASPDTFAFNRPSGGNTTTPAGKPGRERERQHTDPDNCLQPFYTRDRQHAWFSVPVSNG